MWPRLRREQLGRSKTQSESEQVLTHEAFVAHGAGGVERAVNRGTCRGVRPSKAARSWLPSRNARPWKAAPLWKEANLVRPSKAARSWLPSRNARPWKAAPLACSLTLLSRFDSLSRRFTHIMRPFIA